MRRAETIEDQIMVMKHFESRMIFMKLCGYIAYNTRRISVILDKPAPKNMFSSVRLEVAISGTLLLGNSEVDAPRLSF